MMALATVAMDQWIDLALLKVEATNLPALPLRDYNKLRQGESRVCFR